MTEFDRARENFQLYSYCRENGHEDYLTRTERNLRFYAGKQWTAEELAALDQDNRPHLTINETFRTAQAVLGELSQHTADIRFTAYDDVYDKTADALDKLYIHDAVIANDLDFLDHTVRLRGLLFGRGYYDLRIDFDENMQGKTKITTPRPQNIVLDPDIESVNVSEWPRFFRTRWMSYNQVSRTYGKAFADQLKLQLAYQPKMDNEELSLHRMLSRRGMLYGQAAGVDDPNFPQYRFIEQQYRHEAFKDCFIDLETGDMSEVPEDMPKDRVNYLVQTLGVDVIKRRVQTVGWLVTTGDLVAHDQDSPYNEFTIVPYMPYFIDGYTFGLIDQQIDPQRLLNKALSQELHILSTTANSGWIVKAGNLLNMTIEELEEVGAKTGLVREVKEEGGVEKIQPNNVPAGHDRLAQTGLQFTQSMGGANAAMFGEAAQQHVPGKALQEDLARGPVNLFTAISSFFNTKRTLATRFHECVRQYYTETRVIRTTDPMGMPQAPVSINQPTPEGRLVNDVSQGKYFIHMVPSPARQSVEQFAFQQLKELRQDLGVMIPDDVLLSVASIPRRAEIIDRVRQLTGGEVSPEQQRMAELQLRQLEAETAKTEASVDTEAANAELAFARADKARSDAQTDNTAVQAQLGFARLEHERQRDRAQLDQEERKNNRATALELTRMEVERQEAAEERKSKEKTEVAKAKVAAKSKPKPAAKKKPAK
jgi:hypothetical protein